MKRPVQPSGTESKLSDSILERLNLYALAAGAAGVGMLALATPAEAEVIFTKTQVVFGNPSNDFLSVNNNTQPEFFFLDYAGPRGLYSHLTVRPLNGSPTGVEVSAAASFSALALNQGAKIGPSQAFQECQSCSSYALNMVSLRNGVPRGDWANVTNRYLGLRFAINGSTVFGWARLTVQVNGINISAHVTGYAYETTANTPILAGQTSGTADHPVFNPDGPSTMGPRHRRSGDRPVSQARQP